MRFLFLSLNLKRGTTLWVVGNSVVLVLVCSFSCCYARWFWFLFLFIQEGMRLLMLNLNGRGVKGKGFSWVLGAPGIMRMLFRRVVSCAPCIWSASQRLELELSSLVEVSPLIGYLLPPITIIVLVHTHTPSRALTRAHCHYHWQVPSCRWDRSVCTCQP